MKQAPHCDTTNIRHHCTKFSNSCDLVPGICAPLRITTMVMALVIMVMITTVHANSQCVKWFCHLTIMRSEDLKYFSTLIKLPDNSII